MNDNIALALLLLFLYSNLFSLTVTPSPNQDGCMKLCKLLLYHTTSQMKAKLEELATGPIRYTDLIILSNYLSRMTTIASQVSHPYHTHLKGLLHDVSVLSAAYSRVFSTWTRVQKMKAFVRHAYTYPLLTIKQNAIITPADSCTAIQRVNTLVNAATIYIGQHTPCSMDTIDDRIIHSLFQTVVKDVQRVLADAEALIFHFKTLQASLTRKEHVVDAIRWLTTYNTSLCNHILKHCLYSFNDTPDDDNVCKSRFEQLEDDLAQFINVTKDIPTFYYEDLFCTISHSKMDNDNGGGAELFFEYVTLCDRAKKLLTFGRDAFSQREEITGFVQKYKCLKTSSLLCVFIQEDALADHFYQDAMSRFLWITYPQLDITGMDQWVYDYQKSLYLKLSSMKLDLLEHFSNHVPVYI